MDKFEILKLLEKTEKHSGCRKRHVAAVLLERDTEILATGLNNPILSHSNAMCKKCADGKYKRAGIVKPTCPAIHAEVNCLLKYRNWFLPGPYTLLISYSPCPECCKLILSLPIDKIIVKERRTKKLSDIDKTLYDVETYDELAELLLTKAGRIYEVL